MIPLHRGAVGALSIAFLLGAFASPLVRAQEVPAPVAAPDVQTRTFTLRNVRPSLVAFWLDPAHHLAPVEIQVARAVSDGADLNVEDFPMVMFKELGKPGTSMDKPNFPRLPGNGNGPRDLRLPGGISSLMANDAGNMLLVRGTESGLSALEALLPTLDVPLVQYEIQASFYELDRALLPQTALKFGHFGEENADGFGAIAALPVDFQSRIQKLVESKRALLVTEPRITVIEGLGGYLKQGLNTPFLWNETPSVARPVDAPANGQTPQRLAYIRTVIGINASITRVQTDLLAVAIEPRFNTRTLSVLTTIREDEPFAIQFSPSTDKRQIIVVVTPRRVRRAGDDT